MPYASWLARSAQQAAHFRCSAGSCLEHAMEPARRTQAARQAEVPGTAVGPREAATLCIPYCHTCMRTCSGTSRLKGAHADGLKSGLQHALFSRAPTNWGRRAHCPCRCWQTPPCIPLGAQVPRKACTPCMQARETCLRSSLAWAASVCAVPRRAPSALSLQRMKMPCARAACASGWLLMCRLRQPAAKERMHNRVCLRRTGKFVRLKRLKKHAASSAGRALLVYAESL